MAVTTILDVPKDINPKVTNLSSDQDRNYAAVLNHVQRIEKLPVSSRKSAETATLTEMERMWLTRDCLLRFLRATKWHVNDAVKRIEKTLVWRREYGVEKLTPEHVSPESETGKQYILGFDLAGRPCLYLRPARQNTPVSPRQIQHLVYMLERCIDLMPQGVETLALVTDFSSSSHSSNPSASTGKQVLNILQTHYPERLGRAMVINIPFFVWAFFKLIGPFIDPVTREKLKFNENLRELIRPDQLDKDFGGDVEFEYVHDIYWPALTTMAAERREQMLENWRAAGSQIGTSESAMKETSFHNNDPVENGVIENEVGEKAETSQMQVPNPPLSA